MRIRLLIPLLLCLNAGCIVPLPVAPEQDRFAKKITGLVEPGASMRTDVVALFGQPDITRDEGRVVIYGQTRTTATFLAFWGAGYSGGADLFDLESHATLVIQYGDDDVVVQRDTFRSEDDCTEGGLCIVASFDEPGGADLSNAVIMQRAGDAVAESAPSPDLERCIVFVYASGGTATIKLYEPSIGTTWLHERGYLRFTTAPGQIELLAAIGNLQSATIPCDAGNAYYFNVDIGGAAPHPLSIRGVDEETGFQAISKRMRIIR